MTRHGLLQGCELTVSRPSQGIDTGLEPAAASLVYQAKSLGMRCEWASAEDQRGLLAFALKTPDGQTVTGSITGWPDGRQRPASEYIAQAACGLMSIHGRASGRAQALGVNYVSVLASTLALQGLLAAAWRQQRGGTSSHTAVSLASAGLLATGQYLAGASTLDTPERLLPGVSAPSERPPFLSSDGVAFEIETLDAQPWRAFWSALGVDASLAGKAWQAFMLRYARATAPMPPTLMAALARLAYRDIAALCAQVGMSVCPVRTLDERLADVDAHTAWLTGPWRFASGTVPLEKVPCPDAPTPLDLPLAGLSLIESCRRIQGPLAGHLMALLGARVIRIEPPGGDPLRGMPPMAEGVSARFEALNRLKTVREIDIKTEAGRVEVLTLARQADAFLHNWAPDKAADLRLDQSDLLQANPSLVYAYAGGWGEARGHGLPGTDFMVQAYSGMAHRIGQASGMHGGSLFTVLDVLGGAVAAQGLTAALLGRCLTGVSVGVETSLLGAASLLCEETFARHFEPSLPSPAPETGIKGIHPTAAGLIAIDVADAHALRRLATALDVEDPAQLAPRLAGLLLARPASQWQTIFEQHGVAATVVVEDLTDLAKDARLATCLVTGAYARVQSPWSFQ